MMQRQAKFLTKIAQKYFISWMLLILGLTFFLRLIAIDQPHHYIFDEDFFAFTAQLMKNNDRRVFEWWHGPLTAEINQFTYRPPAIEWLHPPLSKTIQATSIAILGNTPFAWRLPSLVAGIMLIWLSIKFTQILFDQQLLSLLAGSLVSLEQLLFAQARLASPDIFLACFILFTLWNFWRYHQKRTLGRLLNVGITLGLAIASKWSGAFIIIGLLIFDFWFYAETKPKRSILRPVWLIIQSWSVLLLTSAIIYLLSYWQLFYQGHSFKYLLRLHQQIWQYQTSATFSHPYASSPWQWLRGKKPIWYVYEKNATGKILAITAQPTRWILLLSELAVGLTIFQLIRNASAKKTYRWWPRLLLILAVFSLYLPWFLIARPLFIYHLTPIMPLLIIVLVDQVRQLLSQIKKPGS